MTAPPLPLERSSAASWGRQTRPLVCGWPVDLLRPVSPAVPVARCHRQHAPQHREHRQNLLRNGGPAQKKVSEAQTAKAVYQLGDLSI